MVWAFWLSIGLLIHTYFLYPALLALASRCWRGVGPGRELQELPGSSEGAIPRVSVVVAAHNEEQCISAKLKNSLALDYPSLEILIGSDGSTDRTDQIVGECGDARVRLSAAPRGGKVAVLNRCVPQAAGEIIVLTDANTDIDPQAIRCLVRNFSNPQVGAVCGRLRLFNPSRSEYEESAYWKYESALKLYEGRLGVLLGANGGLYAIRKSLFTPLRADTIVDDFVIPMRILQAGFRVIYEPEAVAHEETTEDYGKEAARRARISAGNFQSLRDVGGLLIPAPGRALVSFAFWSHKLLRWFAPLLLLIAFVTNLGLLNRAWGCLTMAGQASFYALALASKWNAGLPRLLGRAACIAYYFASMNWALAVGFCRFVRKTQAAAWDRTARPV